MTKRLFMKGNEALAMAAIEAGCRYYFGYPITPQSDIPEYMSRELPRLGGEFIQAESEVASINMLLGASATGVRAMTSSSSPGISLMQEGFSYIAGSEVPCVVVDVMRGGPGLGNIQPSQSDYFQVTRSAGHGDFHPIVLIQDDEPLRLEFDTARMELLPKGRALEHDDFVEVHDWPTHNPDSTPPWSEEFVQILAHRRP